MKNITFFIKMLSNILSYCGSLGYFLDTNVTLNFTYQNLSFARTTNKNLLCELSSDIFFDFAY